ncbi:alpha/beta hydrolase [bacterium]|nr:alpha/beta hydrolase [bacterium]|tara:strand:- start:2041 stop:2826 length:786 start_codon:yes stop_codon:yes gene_type:complete
MNLNYQILNPPTAPIATLLIAHGLFGSKRNWLTIARQLSRQYRVILPDLRNHGDSPHTPIMTYTAMANDIAELCQTLKLSDGLCFIGHSMGGKVAMQTAHNYPPLFRSIVVVDIAPKIYPMGRQTPLFDACLALPVDTVNSRADANRALESQGVTHAEIRAFLLHNLVLTPHPHWRIPLDVLRQHEPEIMAAPLLLNRTDTPALFLRGTASDYILNADIETIHQLFSQAHVTAMPGSHWLHAEHPNVLIAHITEFLLQIHG